MKINYEVKRIKKNTFSAIKYAIPNGLRQQLQPKKFHAYCVGTPKSGTTSLSGMFEACYRADHEPERIAIVDTIYAHYCGRITDEEFIEWQKKHNKRNWLELESSCFVGYRADLTKKAFPNAKFILTVRDPGLWLDSILNNNINYPAVDERTAHCWHEVFFKPTEFKYSRHDAVLGKRNLYPVDAYLSYWTELNEYILSTVSSEDLLVLKTEDIQSSEKDIAQFLGIPVESINSHKGYLHKTSNKYGTLDDIDAGFLSDRIENICGDLIKKLAINVTIN